jgi:predicted RND superfamily exporter protein
MAKGIKMWAVTFGALVVLTTIAVIIIISIFKAKKINKNTSSKKMFKYNNSIRSGYEKSQ